MSQSKILINVEETQKVEQKKDEAKIDHNEEKINFFDIVDNINVPAVVNIYKKK